MSLTVLCLRWIVQPYSSETTDIRAGVGYQIEVRRKEE